MLQANHLTYLVGDAPIIDDISFLLSAGELNLIIGPNGAGKSTLIKLLARQLHPSAGTVSYDGKDISGSSDRSLAKHRAVLSQSIEIAFPLSVSEIVMMGRYPHFTTAPAAADYEICLEAMNLFEVDALADRNYESLSGGEKQRVHFARVTSQIWNSIEGNSRYLFLDEPLTFLDIRYQFYFMRQVRELVQQNDIIIVGVVHDLNLASKFADKLLLLDQGKLLASGTVTEVLTKDLIHRSYGIPPVFIYQNDLSYPYIFFE